MSRYLVGIPLVLVGMDDIFFVCTVSDESKCMTICIGRAAFALDFCSSAILTTGVPRTLHNKTVPEVCSHRMTFDTAAWCV